MLRVGYLVLLLALALPALAEEPGADTAPEAAAGDEADGAAPAALSERDPMEPMNRGLFWFNDKLDVFVVEPLAVGWRFVTPRLLRTGVHNFFTNLRFPARLLSTLGQLELREAGSETLRFVTNTTIGVGGLFDPAGEALGMPLHAEDFGQMLASWGVPGGPYLFVPIFGPSNPRDGFGAIVDAAVGYGTFVPFPWGVVGFVTDGVNSRERVIEDVREAKAASLDYYVFVRNGWLQLRYQQIYERGLPQWEPTEDLYEIDEDYFDDDDE